MTDRPIIFSAPMVRALLDGRKTQTRRIYKVPSGSYVEQGGVWAMTDGCAYGDAALPYATGDRLWVRETHYLTDDGESEYAVFAADQGDVDEHLASMQTTMASHPSIDWSKHLRLRPSIHMPRWASRLTLAVTGVRVQRLQDISEADAVAEGVIHDGFGGWRGHEGTIGYPTAIWAYHHLWNSLHGPGAWDANPWVVAVTFTVQRGNIDQLPGVAG